MVINSFDMECIFAEGEAGSHIETQWSAISITQLVWRSEKKDKRMRKFYDTMGQLVDLYKEIWNTDVLPTVLRSKRSYQADQNAANSLSVFTSKTMVPTSIFIVLLVWGICRSRRRPEDVELVIDSFMSLWALAFAVVKEFNCRVRWEGARYGFVINPMSQVPFLHFLFAHGVQEGLDKDWIAIYNSRHRPKWMSAASILTASVMEVILFLLCHKFREHRDICFQLIRTFSSVVNQMGRYSKGNRMSEKDTCKNNTVFQDAIGRRKERCAHFLLRVNVSRQYCLLCSFYVCLVCHVIDFCFQKD